MKHLKYILALTVISFSVAAQDENEVKEDKPVRAMFESAYLMDKQSVLVYPEKTLEFVMQHRFGTIDNGLSDFYGLYGVSNIRLGLTYVPFKNLAVGYGITKDKMYQDFNIKYAILQQTRSGSMPLSITYYGNAAIDSRAEENIDYFDNSTDRLSYYHEVILARKINSKISIQLTPSYSHFNAVPAFLDNGETKGTMNNDHLAVGLSGRYKITSQGSITFDYNLPITDHFVDENGNSTDPEPNFSFGYEITTSSHAFQVFIGNYWGLVPQVNNFNNQNTEFLIGFNMTRLWSF
jgi:hypothetical protein